MAVTGLLKSTLMHGTDRRVPVVLDTDIGGDIDDTWALAMMLGMPEIDLRLVVTAVDNTPEKTRLVAKLLQETGHTRVPIATGIQTSEDPLTQGAWLGDFDMAQYPGTVHHDGIDALVRVIREAPEPLTLVVIGPETNIAEALRRDPAIAGNARVVAMAGSIHRAHAGLEKPIAECNVVNDIEAFRAVLSAPWDITLTPLDGCGRVVLRGERYSRAQASPAPLARVVMENYAAWTHRKYWPGDASSILFDTVAVYLATGTALCEMRDLALSVDDAGFTVPDPGGRTVHCQFGWRDLGAFEELVVGSLTGDPRV